MLKEKTTFPYEWLNKDNIFDKQLPSIDKFYCSLKLQNISKEEYDKTIDIYKKSKCKNVKDYLEIYMKLDICLQSDISNVFRNCIWNKFEVGCSKYITSCSLTEDLMLKYTKVKIQLFKDIAMFDYANSSVLEGLCITSQNIADNDNGKLTISSCDVCSLYPYIMTQKLPIRNYKFVTKFNKLKHRQNKNHSCLLNVEIYTTNKVKDNKILSQFPALISKKISYDQLSDFQRKNLKNNYKSSEKLINHLGYDKNSYISFEMYEMMKSLGYKINIKKILEYKHDNFMKPYTDFLFERNHIINQLEMLECQILLRY